MTYNVLSGTLSLYTTTTALNMFPEFTHIEVDITWLLRVIILTESAHARILSTDWTTARGTVATWRARRQTRVEPITVSALVPSPALAPIVVPIVDTGTCSVILTRRRGARFRLQQLTVGSRAPV